MRTEIFLFQTPSHSVCGTMLSWPAHWPSSPSLPLFLSLPASDDINFCFLSHIFFIYKMDTHYYIY